MSPSKFILLAAALDSEKKTQYMQPEEGFFVTFFLVLIYLYIIY